MKVAAVGILCQDPRVFQAMQHAGTPCPYEGKVGKEAAAGWAENKEDRPDYKEYKNKLPNIGINQFVDAGQYEKEKYAEKVSVYSHYTSKVLKVIKF